MSIMMLAGIAVAVIVVVAIVIAMTKK